ncbi:3-hydroxyacyl-CoA dehydrogenase NAD-binding domain-containing protein [Gelidibacter sp. F2691]|nr:3-hydroxyacyl-CoA dehydrogenase NAD-binding domain-containing protein [Gelidibacter sp. F2691]
MTVRLTRSGTVAIATIDNPPVNAASHAVRQGLWNILAECENDPTVQTVVLTCAGGSFVAGADIREFGKVPVTPVLPELLRAIEAAKKPWVAAMHGTALGGGLELAMACHYRVATNDARFGLPEVGLGLIPGAGGTVQLPRLVPAELALDMVTTGKAIGAEQALSAGLVDATTGGDLQAFALSFIAGLEGRPRPDAPLNRAVNKPVDPDAFEARVKKVIAKARGQNSTIAAARAVQDALTLPVSKALANERHSFVKLKADPQSAALRYAFFAERGVGKVDRLKGVETAPVQKVGVVGGGTMGAGIAAACLLNGIDVTMVERDQEAADAGAERVAKTLKGSLDRGVISQSEFAAMQAAFQSSTDYGDFAPADLVIEAVFEDFEVKAEVFAKIEKVVRPDAIIATNTSYLDVSKLAQGLTHPARVLGLHFFSPAHIMKLLEIVVPETVSDTALAGAVGFGKRLRKVSVLAGVCDGFIANRIMSAYRRECEFMLEDGALPWQIDAAMVGFGLPMGIYQMQDLAGLDIAWAMRKRQAATRNPKERYVHIADKICEMGRFGQKTGRGWYIYDGKTRTPDPEIEALIIAESHRKGIARNSFDDEQIMGRILARMQAEGRAILDEGIATSAEDIDVVMINAFGFPRWRGGPMFMAGDTGL